MTILYTVACLVLAIFALQALVNHQAGDDLYQGRLHWSESSGKWVVIPHGNARFPDEDGDAIDLLPSDCKHISPFYHLINECGEEEDAYVEFVLHWKNFNMYAHLVWREYNDI